MIYVWQIKAHVAKTADPDATRSRNPETINQIIQNDHTSTIDVFKIINAVGVEQEASQPHRTPKKFSYSDLGILKDIEKKVATRNDIENNSTGGM